MESFPGINGALMEIARVLHNRAFKKLSGKVELSFLSSEAIVCYCQEGKYSKLN